MADKLKNDYPWWKLSLWYGMTARVWFRLLRRYRFGLSANRLHRLIIVSLVTPFNSLFAIAQRLIYGRQIAGQQVPPCIFIIGHWRTGTTFLHDLLSTDPRFLAPTTHQCFCPEHFLVSRPLVRLFGFMLPDKRPTDDVMIGPDSTQEDEFALLASGVDSPYEAFGFPQGQSIARGFFKVPAAGEDAWLAALTRFFKACIFHRKRSGKTSPQFLLLKSPTHTARLELLARRFPEARFIHLVRDPRDVFSSSKRLWTALIRTQGLNVPPDGLDALAEAIVFENFEALYDRFDEAAAGLEPGRLETVKYEDLARAPLAVVERIYWFLEIGPDDRVRRDLAEKVAAVANYKVGQHHLSPETAEMIRRRWQAYGEQYGYFDDAVADESAQMSQSNTSAS